MLEARICSRSVETAGYGSSLISYIQDEPYYILSDLGNAFVNLGGNTTTTPANPPSTGTGGGTAAHWAQVSTLPTSRSFAQHAPSVEELVTLDVSFSFLSSTSPCTYANPSYGLCCALQMHGWNFRSSSTPILTSFFIVQQCMVLSMSVKVLSEWSLLVRITCTRAAKLINSCPMHPACPEPARLDKNLKLSLLRGR
jgi:hypothetical protein